MNQPHHDVATACLVRQGRVLLCHRHPERQWYPDVWDLPGGHIEAGESPATAIRRELHEELGVDVSLEHMTSPGIYEPTAELRLHVFVITEWTGEIRNRAVDEHDDIAWFSAEQIHELDLADPALGDIVINAISQAEIADEHDHPPRID